LENLPDVRALLRMGRAMIDLYCASFKHVAKRIVLDIDDTFDAVHGGQQLRLFNAHYDEYGFQPIVVFEGAGRFIAALLLPAKRSKGTENTAFSQSSCCPEVLDWCRANGLDYILGVAPTTTLRAHIETLEASTKARFEAAPKDGKVTASRNFWMGPRPGAVSSASSSVSKSARKGPTHVSSSPI
jgi:Transposase DDE domain group 1